MRREIKTTLALDGEKRFKEGLADASRQLRVLDSEMKANKASFADNARSLESLTAKGKIFEKQVAQQKEIIRALSQAVKDSSDKYGEADKRTDGYRIKLNNATAALAKMERELEKNKQDISEFSTNTNKAANNLSKMESKAKEAGISLQNMADKLKTAGVAISAVVAGVFAATQGTKEFRKDLSRLEANANMAGQSMGVLDKSMATLNAVTGETDSSVEGLSNLLATGFRDEQLTTLLDSLYGASIKFSDTLKFEGIADGLQETLATGAAIGPFAELLDRSSINLDEFNAGLQQAIANGTEENYVLQILAKTGLSDTYEAWRKNNEAMVEAEEANYRIQEAMGRLTAAIEPMFTPFINKIAELVNKLRELPEVIKTNLQGKSFEDVGRMLGEGILSGLEGIGSLIKTALDSVDWNAAGGEFLAHALEFITGVIDAIFDPAWWKKNWETAIGAALIIIPVGKLLKIPGIKQIFDHVWPFVKGALGNVLKSISTLLLDFGKYFLDGIAKGLGKEAPKLAPLLRAVVQRGVDGLKNLGVKLYTIAGDFMERLGAGIGAKIGAVRNKIIQVASNIIDGLVSGLTKGVNRVVSAAKALADKIPEPIKKILKIKSPSKLMAEFGRYVAEGLAQGIEEKTSEIAQKAQQMAQAISGAVQEMNGRLSSALGLTNAQLDLQKELLGENAEEYKKTEIELKKLIKEKENLVAKIDILTAAYETAKEKLGENNKTTQQYADELALTQIELQKMDISIQKTNLSIEQQKKAVVDAAKAQAKEMRDLASEVEAVEKKYREDLASAAKEYQEKVAEANRKLIDDEQKVTDDYRKQVADRTKSLRDFVGLFDAVSADRVSGRELLANLQGQVTAFADWQKNIGELAARGVDEGLIDELKEMGPKAGPQIAALNTLTDEQLNQYVYLWKEKNQLAREEAVAQLTEQRVEMQNKLQEIRWAAAEQLELYRQEWEKKNAEIRKNADAELLKIETRFKEIAEAGTKYGISLVENFTGGIESRFGSLRSTLERMAEMVDSYMPHSPAKVGPLSKIMEWGPALVGSLADGIDKSLPMLNRAMDNLALSSMTGVGRSVVNNTSNNSNTTVNITVQDGEDLLRTLHRLGVVL